MADTGWIAPSAVDSSSDMADATNLLAEDGSIGFFSAAGGAYGQYDQFGFSIPAGATINGIEVRIKGEDGGFGNEVDVRLVKAGTPTGDTKNLGDFGGTLTFIAVGGASDLWGETLNESDVENAGFGVRISQFSNESPDMDVVEMKIYYTASGGTVYTKDFSDTSNLSDSLAFKQKIERDLLDTSNLSDTLALKQKLNRNFLDTSNLSDNLSINEIRSSRIISETDSFTISDSLSIIRIGDRSIFAADTTTLSDSLTISRSSVAISLDLSDTLGISDNLIIQGQQVLIKPETYIFTLNDQVRELQYE